MINRQVVEEEIEKLEKCETTMAVCEKLACLYTVLDHADGGMGRRTGYSGQGSQARREDGQYRTGYSGQGGDGQYRTGYSGQRDDGAPATRRDNGQYRTGYSGQGSHGKNGGGYDSEFRRLVKAQPWEAILDVCDEHFDEMRMYDPEGYERIMSRLRGMM